MVLVTYNGDTVLKMGNCQKRQMVSLMNTQKKCVFPELNEFSLIFLMKKTIPIKQSEYLIH